MKGGNLFNKRTLVLVERATVCAGADTLLATTAQSSVQTGISISTASCLWWAADSHQPAMEVCQLLTPHRLHVTAPHTRPH
jgi:hypothetical protein